MGTQLKNGNSLSEQEGNESLDFWQYFGIAYPAIKLVIKKMGEKDDKVAKILDDLTVAVEAILENHGLVVNENLKFEIEGKNYKMKMNGALNPEIKQDDNIIDVTERRNYRGKQSGEKESINKLAEFWPFAQLILKVLDDKVIGDESDTFNIMEKIMPLLYSTLWQYQKNVDGELEFEVPVDGDEITYNLDLRLLGMPTIVNAGKKSDIIYPEEDK